MVRGVSREQKKSRREEKSGRRSTEREEGGEQVSSNEDWKEGREERYRLTLELLLESFVLFGTITCVDTDAERT